jgi:membrane-bound serine protease (ClpP class)
VAYILLLIGIYGLIYEFSNPGAVLPGTLGAMSLLLALYAFQLLPVNYAGLALMVLGLALMIGEAFTPSFGALGLGGTAAFVAGSLILIDTDVPGLGISLPLILGVAVTSALLLGFMATMALRAWRRPVASGAEELEGAQGEAVSGFPGGGRVHLHGEIWAARSPVPIPRGAPIRVVGREGLTLLVEPLPQGQRTPQT